MEILKILTKIFVHAENVFTCCVLTQAMLCGHLCKAALLMNTEIKC